MYAHGTTRKAISPRFVEIHHLPSGTWEQKPITGDPPLGIIRYASAAIGNDIFYFGGECNQSGSYCNSLSSFNVDTLNWREHSPNFDLDGSYLGPSKKTRCGMVALQLDGENYLAVIGGMVESMPTLSTLTQSGVFYDSSGRCNEIHYFKLSPGQSQCIITRM